MRHVFEFRDPTWITEEVLELLGEKGASVCAHDMPNVPTPRWATGPIAYVRFHGASGKYWGRYSKEELCEWRDWRIDQSRQDREVWAYFKNDTEAKANDDATAIKGQSVRTGKGRVGE